MELSFEGLRPLTVRESVLSAMEVLCQILNTMEKEKMWEPCVELRREYSGFNHPDMKPCWILVLHSYVLDVPDNDEPKHHTRIFDTLEEVLEQLKEWAHLAAKQQGRDGIDPAIFQLNDRG